MMYVYLKATFCDCVLVKYGLIEFELTITSARYDAWLHDNSVLEWPCDMFALDWPCDMLDSDSPYDLLDLDWP